jgi:hypothetical protein
MVVIFILFVVLALLCMVFGFVYKADEEKSFSWILGCLFVLFTLVASACGNELWGEKPIKPIDVYRGKTTLEITYKDSVAIDSVVVWK